MKKIENPHEIDSQESSSHGDASLKNSKIVIKSERKNSREEKQKIIFFVLSRSKINVSNIHFL